MAFLTKPFMIRQQLSKPVKIKKSNPMQTNLLFDTNSIDWENLSINRSECLENIQEVISQVIIDENRNFKPISFDDLTFLSGENRLEIHRLFEIEVLRELNAEWFLPYAYSTFSQIYTFPLTPNLADNLNDLKSEFADDCNALLSCNSEDSEVVYDLLSYAAIKNNCKAIQDDLNKPRLSVPSSQIEHLIKTHLKHLFDRLDVPTKTPKGTLHEEQIHIHIYLKSNSGKKKHIGALNIDGTWKHKPSSETHQIPNEAKEKLLEWGFRLPD